jgi:signal transduction histidine kinase
VAQAVQSAVEANGPLIESMGHQITLALPPDPLMLDADLARLTQIVSNLVDNAASHSPPGARMEVSAAREAGDIVVRVKDNGNGIAPGDLERIFEMFVQAGVPFARSQGGLGIGLALVRTLVGMHGGRIEARSDGLGQGSEFIVRLPMTDAVHQGPPSGGVMEVRS